MVSSAQTAEAMAAKARRYLSAGTRLVWVVWPDHRRIDIWHPGDTQPSSRLGMGDSLDGEDALAGFSHPMADIFS